MRQSILFSILSLALSVSLFASACSEAPDPGPDADTRYMDCQAWCSEVDEDILSLPANMCPGHDPAEDTAYNRCVGECVAHMPDGYWCPSP